MTKIIRSIFIILMLLVTTTAIVAQVKVTLVEATADVKLPFFKGNNRKVQYTGRVDFSNPSQPRFWSPGVYVKMKFKGPVCELLINDEVLHGNSHNYIAIVVDNDKPFRIQTTGKTNLFRIENLRDAIHTVTVCKNTESGIGYLEFAGIRCRALLDPVGKPLRKIEFIGNSITCGSGSDLTIVKCNEGQWYDQQNAYLSYGAITARNVKAQWHLTAVSGIGLVHSCCNMTITMPQVFDKVNLRTDSIKWNFSSYQPDVVTVCLGQNDGIQDSVKFCTAYVNFLKDLRRRYPLASIVCLTSPMADAKLVSVMKNYLGGIVSFMNRKGDKKVSSYFFSRSFNRGCGGHPDLEDHKEIAKELTAYVKKLKGW